MKKGITIFLTIFILALSVYILASMQQREVYLSDIDVSYKEVGYYDLCFNG